MGKLTNKFKCTQFPNIEVIANGERVIFVNGYAEVSNPETAKELLKNSLVVYATEGDEKPTAAMVDTMDRGEVLKMLKEEFKGDDEKPYSPTMRNDELKAILKAKLA